MYQIPLKMKILKGHSTSLHRAMFKSQLKRRDFPKSFARDGSQFSSLRIFPPSGSEKAEKHFGGNTFFFRFKQISIINSNCECVQLDVRKNELKKFQKYL